MFFVKYTNYFYFQKSLMPQEKSSLRAAMNSHLDKYEVKRRPNFENLMDRVESSLRENFSRLDEAEKQLSLEKLIDFRNKVYVFLRLAPKGSPSLTSMYSSSSQNNQ